MLIIPIKDTIKGDVFLKFGHSIRKGRHMDTLTQ